MKDLHFLKDISFYFKLDEFCNSNDFKYTTFTDYSLSSGVVVEYFSIRRTEDYILYEFNLYSKYDYCTISKKYERKYFIDITFPSDLFNESFLKKVYESNYIKEFKFNKKSDCFTFELILNDGFNYDELISFLNDYFRCILVIDKFLDEDRFTEFKK